MIFQLLFQQINSGCAFKHSHQKPAVRGREKVHVFSQRHEEITAQLKSPPIGCFHGPDMERLFPVHFHSSSVLSPPPPFLPSDSFTPSTVYSTLSSFVLIASLAHPCGRAFEGSVSNTSKGFLAGAACFSFFVYARVCFYSTIQVPSYLASLICGACYWERTVSCYLFVGSYSPEEVIISLSTIQGSECTNPSAQYPLCILMVPAYAQEAVAVSLLVMPVGCFQSSPLPASHAHVSISLSVVCSHAVVANFCLCLFLLALFPRREHVAETQRRSERG